MTCFQLIWLENCELTFPCCPSSRSSNNSSFPPNLPLCEQNKKAYWSSTPIPFTQKKKSIIFQKLFDTLDRQLTIVYQPCFYTWDIFFELPLFIFLHILNPFVHGGLISLLSICPIFWNVVHFVLLTKLMHILEKQCWLIETYTQSLTWSNWIWTFTL